MNDINFRRMQEAVANLLQVKDEVAKGLYEMYSAYVNVGFSEEQALRLVMAIVTPRIDNNDL